MSIPRIIIAGTSSGVGKTSVTLGILHKFKELGFKIQSFKVGPDFIDPAYHTFVTNNPCYNLDSWLMGEKGVINTFEKYTRGKDIAVVEGVMGLFDGAEGKNNFASTAQIAKILDSPIILVIDASKAARSIAAIAYGFMNFDKGLKIKGIILNKIASNKHFQLIKDAFDNNIKIPIVGVIYKNQEFTFSERHLGLIPTAELDNKRKKKILDSVRTISDCLDPDKLISLIMPLKNKKTLKKKDKTIKQQPKNLKIAVALDNSFNFYYQENLDILQKKGAELIFFSPLNDNYLPEEINGILLGGGFPEILSKDLTKNQSMMNSIKKIAETEIPLYAECGGLMYLTKSIKEGIHRYKKNNEIIEFEENSQKTYKMIGLIDAVTKMTNQLTLNYTQGKILNESFLFGKVKNIRGHEFHYSKIENIHHDIRYSYYLEKGIGISEKKDGIIVYNTIASYTHLHFSNSKLPMNFVLNCKKYSKK
ncbi:MAG TPA: cobyrinate a,c-diamide synthase [Nitrososphaeraceae archaeon]|jgi:cobyrinic acid a,c-diamide synthase|nr:cobyrinate a,c-diamide synthase [Nitrososphaeraceae archaeon]